MKNVARLIVAKARDRNNPSGTRGWDRVAMRIGNAMSATTPTAIAIHASASDHRCCSPRMRPKDSPPIARAATRAPSQSNRPSASSSRDSATCRIVAQRAAMMNGMLSRNANRQPIVSTMVPPTIGPRSVSADVADAQTPNARAREAPSKAWVISDRDPGTSSAPVAPWRSRKTTSHSRVGARPHRADVPANPVRPITYMRRRP